MWVTRVILGIVLLHLRTNRRIWSHSCRVEESCLTRLTVTPHSRADAIMNHNKVGLFLGMQSSTFESKIWAFLSSRRVRDKSKYGVLLCLRRTSAIQSLTTGIRAASYSDAADRLERIEALAVSQSLHGKTEYHVCACTLLI